MHSVEKENILTNISGFPEFTPKKQILFNKIKSIICETYESFGAVPIETSAIERVQHILAKGGNDKEIYGLHRLNDKNKETKEYALHFDLTLPLARYISQNSHLLTFPFKRYQAQPVWRGEKAQNKRYRQFYQCDIDVIGDGKLSIMYDAEMSSIIYHIFMKLNIGSFVIHISNRKILNGIFFHFGIKNSETLRNAIKIIDDLEKIDIANIKERFLKIGMQLDALEEMIKLLTLDLSSDQIIKKLSDYKYGSIFKEGVSELKTVINAIRSFGVPDDYFKVDLTIARGLDYYTGTIYETRLTSNPEIGSICSGGRYDNLTNNFSNKHFPGVGISIGLNRLLAELLESGVMKTGLANVTVVMVTVLDKSYMKNYLKIASMLREAGIKTELYLEEKKLQKQISHASKKGIPYLIIAGEKELTKNSVLVKDLLSQDQNSVCIKNIVSYIKNLILVSTASK